MNAALAMFTAAELIETLVLGCLQGQTASEGKFGTATLIGDVYHFETVRGHKGTAWAVVTDGMHGGWMVQLEGKEAHGPDYLLEMAWAAVRETNTPC